MSQHTPGPWWASQSEAGYWSVRTFRDHDDPVRNANRVGTDYGACIALPIGDGTELRTSGNEEANARLIAAAPDLLAALEQLLASVQRSVCDGSGPAQDAARTAIAKATGGAA